MIDHMTRSVEASTNHRIPGGVDLAGVIAVNCERHSRRQETDAIFFKARIRLSNV
jgi:hypothetical protein